MLPFKDRLLSLKSSSMMNIARVLYKNGKTPCCTQLFSASARMETSLEILIILQERRHFHGFHVGERKKCKEREANFDS
jgi:hypothetical protein